MAITDLSGFRQDRAVTVIDHRQHMWQNDVVPNQKAFLLLRLPLSRFLTARLILFLMFRKKHFGFPPLVTVQFAHSN